MNKLILILVISICGSTAFSQNKFQQELSFGANGGLTFSSVRFTPSVRQKSLMQFEGGLSARFISEKNFGIQTELNYSQRGWEEYNPDIPEHQYARSLGYLEIPVLTHIYFETGKRFRIIFNLGPQIGFLLNEKTLKSHIVYPDGEEIPPYYSQPTQRVFDWGLCGGGGFEIRSGIGNFAVEGRYYFGLSDIFSNKKSDYFDSSSNQVVGVKLTYFM